MDLLRSGRGAPDAAEPLAIDRNHLHELLQITAKAADGLNRILR